MPVGDARTVPEATVTVFTGFATVTVLTGLATVTVLTGLATVTEPATV